MRADGLSPPSPHVICLAGHPLVCVIDIGGRVRFRHPPAVNDAAVQADPDRRAWSVFGPSAPGPGLGPVIPGGHQGPC